MNDETFQEQDSMQTISPRAVPAAVPAAQGAEARPPENDDSMQTMRPGWRTQEEWTGKHWAAGEAILGRYVVEGELRRGGMGVVYACMDKVGGVRVAVKALPPEVAHDQTEMEDMRANFQLVGGLRHPNIAGVRTLEQSPENEVFLVMDIAEGKSLRGWLKERWRGDGVALEDALPILRQVASALDYAHKMRVVHRDVKPGNVMIDANGDVKVLDFGLAEQIRTSMSRVSRDFGGTSGTRAYMAPEQWSGRRQDAKTDQYALAAMAYEMLAGCVPFEGNDVGVLKDAVLHDDIEDIPNLPASAMAALRRGMAKTRAERFDTCEQFVAALSGAPAEAAKPKLVVRKTDLAGAKAAAAEPAVPPAAEPPPKKKWNGPWLWLAVVAVAGLVFGIVFGIMKSSQAKSRAITEQAAKDAQAAIQELTQELAKASFEVSEPPAHRPEPLPPVVSEPPSGNSRAEDSERASSPSWEAEARVAATAGTEASPPPVRETAKEAAPPPMQTPVREPAVSPEKPRVAAPPPAPAVKKPDPKFEPLERALEAVQDNPTGGNYLKLETVWKALPSKQKEATKKNVMWALCAMLMSKGNMDAVSARRAFIDFQALKDAVTDPCSSCGGGGTECRHAMNATGWGGVPSATDGVGSPVSAGGGIPVRNAAARDNACPAGEKGNGMNGAPSAVASGAPFPPTNARTSQGKTSRKRSAFAGNRSEARGRLSQKKGGLFNGESPSRHCARDSIRIWGEGEDGRCFLKGRQDCGRWGNQAALFDFNQSFGEEGSGRGRGGRWRRRARSGGWWQGGGRWRRGIGREWGWRRGGGWRRRGRRGRGRGRRVRRRRRRGAGASRSRW
jgi:serine/threonine-protein kinase